MLGVCYSPSTQEAEAEGWGCQGQLGLYSHIISQEKGWIDLLLVPNVLPLLWDPDVWVSLLFNVGVCLLKSKKF